MLTLTFDPKTPKLMWLVELIKVHLHVKYGISKQNNLFSVVKIEVLRKNVMLSLTFDLATLKLV